MTLLRTRILSNVSAAPNKILGIALALLSAMPAAQAQPQPHTDPLNLTAAVRDAYEHFYNLDYDGSIARFEDVLKANPKDPMAYNYLLMVTIFRELYHQDLLDTTYYAHDSFLTNKRNVQIPAATRDRIEYLTNTSESLCEERIKANPQDADAWFERGYARGMHAAFITLADHSFTSAARQGYAARNDSEQALKIDPNYADAKMAVGIQQFAVASLPRFVRVVVGIMGVGGNKERGLKLLHEAADHGIVTRVESRTALSLFLRHDARYAEAFDVQHGLATDYPHDYLFRLEEANLKKDAGKGLEAIALYKAVLADTRKPGYFVDPRLQMAYFGLADTERGQNMVAEAGQHYLDAASQPNSSDWLRRRELLYAGEMFDLQHNRPEAIKQYEAAAAPGGDQSQADAARRFIKTPFVGR